MAVGGRGLAGVSKRAEEIASQRTGFGLRKFTSEFRWDGNKPPAENQLYLRPLGDDIIMSTQMHRGVPLPDNKFFFGVCRKAFPIEADFCHVCDVLNPAFDGDNKLKKRNGLLPTDVAVALAVEMEPVMEGRVFVGYRLKMVEFEIPQTTDDEKSGKATDEAKEYRVLLDKLGQPGAKVKIPNFGMLVGTISGQQALFDIPTRRSSISDRVFEIARHGKGLETKWAWEHEGADRDNPDPAPLLAEYASKYPFELPEEWVIRNAAVDRYNFFFKLGETATEGGATVAVDKKDDVKPVADSRAELMKRLSGNN